MSKDKELRKSYYSYIIPSIVSQVVFTAYTLVDGVFVARGVSETALAAINMSAPFVNTLWAVSIAFAGGTSAVAARLMGEGKLEEARKVFTRNVIGMSILGIIIAIVVSLSLDPFCEMLGATDATREYLRTYVGTIAPFSIFFIASYTFEILLATDGYPSLATTTVSIGVVANIILDYLLIIVWGMGVRGAAIATALAQVMVIIAYLKHFTGPKAHIKFCKVKMDIKSVVSCFLKGLPTGINELSPGCVTFIFVHAIQKYLNEDALVAYSAVAYLAALLGFIAVGIAQGTQPLLSYYNGSGEKENVSKLLKFQFRTVTCIETVAVAAVILLATPLIKIFITSGESLIGYGAFVLKIFVVSCLFIGYNIVLASFFTSQEKPVRGSIISLSRCTIMLVIGVAISVRLFGPDGIWWGMTIAEILTLIVALILLKKDEKN